MQKVIIEFETWMKDTIELHQQQKKEAIKDEDWEGALKHHRTGMIYMSILAKLNFMKTLNRGEKR